MPARRGNSGKKSKRTAAGKAKPKVRAAASAKKKARTTAARKGPIKSAIQSAIKRLKKAGKKATRAVPAARVTGTRKSYAGGCHCGALEYTFETAMPPRRWAVRSCQCSFCRGHGARTAADPAGLVQFDFKLPEFLRRYRFGLRTGDFLICRECGTYIASVLLTGRGAMANVNINTLREMPKALPVGKPVEPELEAIEQRRALRARSWTPVMGPV